MIAVSQYLSGCAVPAVRAAAHWLAPQPQSCALAERREGIRATAPRPEASRPQANNFFRHNQDAARQAVNKGGGTKPMAAGATFRPVATVDRS